jgi:hypothetical protein
VTEVSRSLDVVKIKPELAGAKMEHGPRKEMRSILDISFITRWMWNMV